MIVDHEAMRDEIDIFDPLTGGQLEAARLVVCGYSRDAREAAEMMLMLGIHPSQEEETCADLNRGIIPSPSEALLRGHTMDAASTR